MKANLSKYSPAPRFCSSWMLHVGPQCSVLTAARVYCVFVLRNAVVSLCESERGGGGGGGGGAELEAAAITISANYVLC